MGFYGPYENQFVVAQSELTNISLSFSLATVTVCFLPSVCRFKNSMLWMGKQLCHLSH